MKKVFKQQPPLISVIVPVYNVEKYLDRCVESIVNQSYKNLEIILVDDGSPDNCPKICDDWSKRDKRIRVIHKENGGVSQARNKGISFSTGKYISFVDSDDYISYNMIEILYSLISKYHADISICNITRYEKKLGKLFENDVVVYNKDEYLKKYFRINSQSCEYYPVNKLYKKDILSDNMFPSKYKEGEDTYGVLTAVLKSSKVVYNKSILYFYRTNVDSVTSSYSDTDFNLFGVWDDITNLLKNTEYYDYAVLNRKRLDFTILMRMALNIRYDILKNDNDVKNLLKNLKLNEKYLLKSSMRFDRKILIFMFCRNYYFVSKILYFIKNKGSKK